MRIPKESLIYHKKQFGTLMVVALLLAVLLEIFLGIKIQSENPNQDPKIYYILYGAALFLALVTWLFYSLSITLTQSKEILISFGPGLIRKRYDLSKAVSAIPVKNPFYYGWGIRMIPKGWLYNVSGSKAVEICFQDGKCIRVGTEEPEQLATAINQLISGNQ